MDGDDRRTERKKIFGQLCKEDLRGCVVTSPRSKNRIVNKNSIKDPYMVRLVSGVTEKSQ